MPPGDFWVELLNKMPGWFFPMAAIVLLAALLVSVIWLALGAKRVANLMGREDRLVKLMEDLHSMRAESVVNQEVAKQAKLALTNLGEYIRDMNQLAQVPETERELRVSDFIRRVLDAVASDVKHRSGAHHRCGLWVEDEGELILTVASTGFPESYLEGGRTLDINRSLAGRAFRRRQSLRCNDVRADTDWQVNPDSKSPYQAVICIPLMFDGSCWGVLTIDSLEPMDELDMIIGEVYGELIEGAQGTMAMTLAEEADDDVDLNQEGVEDDDNSRKPDTRVCGCQVRPPEGSHQ